MMIQESLQMERFNQTGKQRRNLRMYQFQQAQSNKEQEQAFHELEYSNRGEASLVKARRH